MPTATAAYCNRDDRRAWRDSMYSPIDICTVNVAGIGDDDDGEGLCIYAACIMFSERFHSAPRTARAVTLACQHDDRCY